MRLLELLDLCQIEQKTLPNIEVGGITSSSNCVCQGDIFVAVKGLKTDGASFIEQAVAKGAVAVLADRELKASVPVICVSDLRHTQAVMASYLYPSANIEKVAVTGTNGKTSTVFFVRQLLNAMGDLTASMGTIGISSPVYSQDGHMTTPDSTVLAKSLSLLDQKGIRFVAMEASSHGLDQKRLDGVLFKASAFTNLTRDHLDYHKSMDAYFEAKARLFLERTQEGGYAILNSDIPEFEALQKLCADKKLNILSYGKKATDLKLISQKPVVSGQEVELDLSGVYFHGVLKVYGDFQVMNILCAIGLCMGLGKKAEEIVPFLENLQAPDGRIDLAGFYNGATIFTDYAHTPDALERVLLSLRAHTENRLICLFGCGGNRDTGKRSQMGAIAERLADVVYITDDNPRFEEAMTIRNMIKESCPKGIVVDKRSTAIKTAIQGLQKGDILVLCGKGHETGQIIGDTTYMFNDKTLAQCVINTLSKDPLWQGCELNEALSALKQPVDSALVITGLSIDTRTIKPGDLFIALKGEKTDGHLYATCAIQKGASAVLTDHILEGIFKEQQIVVSDTMVALEELARYARQRTKAVFVGITGSSGKTTTKEMLKTCFADQGSVFATGGNFNNQIGVPLTMAQIPQQTQFAVIEMGMNHTGEMRQLTKIVQPDISIITMIGSAHHAFFKTQEDIASAKAEIFEGQTQEGIAILNHDSPFFSYLKGKVTENKIQHIVTFGSQQDSMYHLDSCEVQADKMLVKATIKGQQYQFSLNFLGRHFAQNALAVLAGVEAAGGDLNQAIASLEKALPVAGRGAVFTAQTDLFKDVQVIDDAYNANPSSMIASIASLGLRKASRKIAVLGDMLELGEQSQVLHESIATALIENKIDKVYTIGKEMQAAHNLLPINMKACHTMTASEMVPVLLRELKDKDCVLIKASFGMNLRLIVTALKGETK